MNIIFLCQISQRGEELICEEKLAKPKMFPERENKNWGLISYSLTKFFKFLDNSLLFKRLNWIKDQSKNKDLKSLTSQK